MNYLGFILIFIIAAVISYILTLAVKHYAIKWGFFDQPGPRKIHPKPVPRLGGLAFFVTFLMMVLVIIAVKPDWLQFSASTWFGHLDKRLFGVLLGAIILVIVGIIDDKKGLKPATKLFWQIVAAGVVVAFGVEVGIIRNPFGGPLIHLDIWQIPFQVFGHTYNFVVIADLLAMVWIVAMINILNFLDGLDGLAGGVSFIGFGILFLVCLLPEVNQISTAVLCLILAGAVFGFLPHNFHPAKIFMGDSGSMFLGFMLAVISMISGGKVAALVLVLGFPILDALWVVFRRLFYRKSPFTADKKHLHHRFLAVGLTQRQTVLVIYFLTAAFGVIALFIKTYGKFWALVWLLGIMIVLAVGLVIMEKRKKIKAR